MQDNVMKVERKMDQVTCVLRILNDFCRNKLGKASPDQKFGEANPSRQRVWLPYSYEI